MGSMLVIIILLLMPSIPAIQQKVIEDEKFNDLSEQFDFKELSQIKQLGRLKRPFLYLIVHLFFSFRALRAFILFCIAIDTDTGHWIGLHTDHPLLWKRMEMLLYSIETWLVFWEYISCKFGWNWIF
jgi:hypothetical protein